MDSATVVPVRYHQREHSTAASFRPRRCRAAALPTRRGARTRQFGGRWSCRSSTLPVTTRLFGDASGWITRSLHSGHPRRSTRGSGGWRFSKPVSRDTRRTEATPMPTPPAGSPLPATSATFRQWKCACAREAGPASQFASSGRDLTWRELAFTSLTSTAAPHGRAIPEWARRELTAAESDDRPALTPPTSWSRADG